jgi:hypothetical protein
MSVSVQAHGLIRVPGNPEAVGVIVYTDEGLALLSQSANNGTTKGFALHAGIASVTEPITGKATVVTKPALLYGNLAPPGEYAAEVQVQEDPPSVGFTIKNAGKTPVLVVPMSPLVAGGAVTITQAV